MHILYDNVSDSLYVGLYIEAGIARRDESAPHHYEDYSADDTLVGLTFLHASKGIDMSGLPFKTFGTTPDFASVAVGIMRIVLEEFKDKTKAPEVESREAKDEERESEERLIGVLQEDHYSERALPGTDSGNEESDDNEHPIQSRQ